MIKKIKLSSYAKINLSIDVKGVLKSGMHEVDMVMQQLAFHDDVTVKYESSHSMPKGKVDIVLKTNSRLIPTDERNHAYKAAVLMAGEYAGTIPGGTVTVEVFKRIPVSAGMAGGSGNGAAVLHGLNVLWNLRLSVSDLCRLGATIGSDVPFCVMGQAKSNFCLPGYIRKDPLASSCARAKGTGTEMIPACGLRKYVVMAKPHISVSTSEVYRGIDSCGIKARPDNDRLVSDLAEGDIGHAYKNCVNVLENYTLAAYPKVKELKEKMKAMGIGECVLMSGSGPTVFALCGGAARAKRACGLLREQGYEAYWTKTTR